MQGKHTSWMLSAVVVICCLIYTVTAIVSMTCTAKGKWGCAEAAGFTASVFGMILSGAAAFMFWGGKHGGGGGGGGF